MLIEETKAKRLISTNRKNHGSFVRTRRKWKDKNVVSESEGDNPHFVAWVIMTNKI